MSTTTITNIKYTVIVFIALIVLSVNAAAPVLDGFAIDWGRVGKTITIKGTNFGTATPTVWVDGVEGATIYLSDTMKCFTMYGSPTARQWTISVSNPAGEMSNSLVLFAAGVDPDLFYQINDVYYLVGDFEQVGRGLFEVSRYGGGNLYPVTYINSTHMKFFMNTDLVQSYFVLFYGSYTEGAYNAGGQYAPVILASSFTPTGLTINGFLYSAQTTIKTGNPAADCEITSQTYYILSCVPKPTSLLNPTIQFQVTQSSGKQTTMPFIFTSLNGFVNDANNKCILSVTNFNFVPNSPLIGGISDAPITPIYKSDSEVKFSYPADAKCGYAFILSGGNRLTNNLIVCPRPLFFSVDMPSDANGYVLTVNGVYLYPYMNDPNTLTQTLFFTYTYADGVTNVCPPNVVWQPSDSSYIFTCTISRPNSFIFYVNTTTGDSNRFQFGNTPIITNASPTDYLVPGVVTITGKFFYEYQLLVTIGATPCSQATAVSSTKITCMFPSNVTVFNFNNPLAVEVSSEGNVGSEAVFLYNRPNPVITGATSITYSILGNVTITGSFFYSTNPIYVSIGDKECVVKGVNVVGTEITCTFPSTASPNGFVSPLNVHVSIDNTYNATAAVFNYFRLNPIITSSTSTTYGTPGQVTITGNFFSSKGLVVSIDGTPCTSPTVIGVTQIVCTFSSNTVVSNFKTPLAITVKDSLYTVTNSVFYYVRPNPVVSGATPTKYLSAGQVTITGKYFISPDSLSVTIGASICSSPSIISQDTITCQYQSDVAIVNNEALNVIVTIDNTFIGSSKVFLYIKEGVSSCPIGANNQICSDHGTCNQQLLCVCDQGWESSDCSIKNIGVTIKPPVINETDTSTTITTPSGNKFDVGIVMLNEIDSDSNVVLSINTNNIKWNVTNDNNNNNTNIYKATLNNNSTLLVRLTINDKDERVYYNFAGDVIPILPQSIKYQIELYDWVFSSSLNSVEFIFKSSVVESDDQCGEQETTTTNTGDSIRNIQMTLNGETLIGTFSDRMILDNRPTYNKVNKLTSDQIKNKYRQLESTSTTAYISIITSYFKSSVIVDPNFGVLVSSTPSNECDNGMPRWKLAVIVVCSVIGAAIIGTIVVWMIKNRNSLKIKIIEMKLKRVK